MLKNKQTRFGTHEPPQSTTQKLKFFQNFDTSDFKKIVPIFNRKIQVVLEIFCKESDRMQQNVIIELVGFLLRNATVIKKCRVHCKMRGNNLKLNILSLCSLIHRIIAKYTLGFSHSKSNCIRNFKTCPKNEFFT